MLEKKLVTREQLEEVISHLNECTDAYLFIFDLKNDDLKAIIPYDLEKSLERLI